jgi:hypothetical protein
LPQGCAAQMAADLYLDYLEFGGYGTTARHSNSAKKNPRSSAANCRSAFISG